MRQRREGARDIAALAQGEDSQGCKEGKEHDPAAIDHEGGVEGLEAPAGQACCDAGIGDSLTPSRPTTRKGEAGEELEELEEAPVDAGGQGEQGARQGEAAARVVTAAATGEAEHPPPHTHY